MTINGTPGNDHLTGTSGDDQFDLKQGGSDTVSGLGGDDLFVMRGALDGGDRLDGGDGTDTVVVASASSRALIINSSMFTSIENLVIKGGNHIYNITLDGAAAAGESLTINTTALPAITGGLSFDADATAPTAGSYHFLIGAGTNKVLMGDQLKASDHISDPTGYIYLMLSGDYTMRFSARTMVDIANLDLDHTHNYHFVEHDGNVTAGFQMLVSGDADADKTDYFNGSAETSGSFSFGMAGSGTMLFQGGAGDDQFEGRFNAADRLDGGGGDDTFYWDSGTTSIRLTSQLKGIDTLMLLFPVNYDIVTGGDIADAGKRLTVNAGISHSATSTLIFNDSNDHTGALDFINGTEKKATVTGTGQHDTFDLTSGGAATIVGGGGADTIHAGAAGAEKFIYNAVTDSAGANYDSIVGANFANETFLASRAGAATTGVDAAVTAGTLSTASFDTDLATAVGSGQMAAHHAVLFTANAGTLSGHTFLVIDENGTAGYQASADLVIDVTGTTGTLTAANFA